MEMKFAQTANIVTSISTQTFLIHTLLFLFCLFKAFLKCIFPKLY